jgi:hypothetical protein
MKRNISKMLYASSGSNRRSRKRRRRIYEMLFIMLSASLFNKIGFIVTVGSPQQSTRKKDKFMRAVMIVKNKEVGLMRASREHEISDSTLKHHVDSTEHNTE